MKYTKIPTNTFKELTINAGVLLSSFDTSTATVDDSAIIGATTGGLSVTATPSFTDFGEDIDNCPKNMKELKKLESWEIKVSGTFVSFNQDTAEFMAGNKGTATGGVTKIALSNEVVQDMFQDIWVVGDYSEYNGDKNGGYVAVHLSNVMSTGGFSWQTTDKGKGNFAFEGTAHYSQDAQETVPMEIYIKAGTVETQADNSEEKAVADETTVGD